MELNDYIKSIDKRISSFREAKTDEKEINSLKNEIRKFISKQPETGKELGKYFSIIDSVIKSKKDQLELVLFPILKGRIAIGHKPGGKISFNALKGAGVNIILTLLQEKEGALSIKQGVEKEGLDWIWFPFSASKPPQGGDINCVKDLYYKLKTELESGKNMYIHCSAGIHRTGMVTYGLLRFLGTDQTSSRQILSKLRKVTSEQVGEDRLAWGDVFYNSEMV